MHTIDTHTHTCMDPKLCTYSVSEVGTNSLGGGPVRWMAPESILKRKYSFSSDVYAFGVSASACVCDYSASMRVCARALRCVPQVMSVDMRLDHRCANICSICLNLTIMAALHISHITFVLYGYNTCSCNACYIHIKQRLAHLWSKHMSTDITFVGNVELCCTCCFIHIKQVLMWEMWSYAALPYSLILNDQQVAAAIVQASNTKWRQVCCIVLQWQLAVVSLLQRKNKQ